MQPLLICQSKLKGSGAFKYLEICPNFDIKEHYIPTGVRKCLEPYHRLVEVSHLATLQVEQWTHMHRFLSVIRPKIYSRVPLMWTPKGGAKSVHVSEPSTVVDTLSCRHLII